MYTFNDNPPRVLRRKGDQVASDGRDEVGRRPNDGVRVPTVPGLGKVRIFGRSQGKTSKIPRTDKKDKKKKEIWSIQDSYVFLTKSSD